MRIALRLISGIGLLVCVVRIFYELDFAAVAGAIAALCTFISTFVVKVDPKQRASQSQELSGKSVGVQAGRDANVKNWKQ